MKTKYLISIILCLYLSFSFYHISISPIDWSDKNRGAFAFISFLFIGIKALFDQIKEDEA